LAAAAAGAPAELAQSVFDALAADPKRRPAARALATRYAAILGVDAAFPSADSSAVELATPVARAGARLSAAAERGGFGPLIEQYAGDSRPTVLEDAWQRPRPNR
jgi:hypothetical protein